MATRSGFPANLCTFPATVGYKNRAKYENANKLFHTQFTSNLHLNIGLLSKKGLRVQSIIFRDKRSFNKRTFHLSMFAKFSSVKIVVRIWIQSLLAFFGGKILFGS